MEKQKGDESSIYNKEVKNSRFTQFFEPTANTSKNYLQKCTFTQCSSMNSDHELKF